MADLYVSVHELKARLSEYLFGKEHLWQRAHY